MPTLHYTAKVPVSVLCEVDGGYADEFKREFRGWLPGTVTVEDEVTAPHVEDARKQAAQAAQVKAAGTPPHEAVLSDTHGVASHSDLRMLELKVQESVIVDFAEDDLLEADCEL